ncbi:hypothetical protein ZWY2020_025840, partial [Hordeum vulgare]
SCLKRDSGHVTTKNLLGLMKKLRGFTRWSPRRRSLPSCRIIVLQIRFELELVVFLQEYLNLQARAPRKETQLPPAVAGGRKNSSSFLNHHYYAAAISTRRRSLHVAHINTYLGEDPFLKKYLPIDLSGNQLFDLIRDGLINVAVPGTIDERAINKKRPHLVLGLISQIIKIQLLADLNLKKTPQLVELFDDSKAGYKKTVNNFFGYFPETTLETKDPDERAKMLLEQAEKLDCKRYLTPKDITEGSANLNLAFVAQIVQHRNGLTSDIKQVTLTQTASRDDVLVSREERAFGCGSTALGSSHVNNVFEDVRNGTAIVVKIGKELKFSLVNLAGNDIIPPKGSQGKQITDADILNWANSKVKASGRTSRMESFKKLNATYIISVARKLGCSVFLLPEDIIEVNQKMILTLTASIMYWSLLRQPQPEISEASEPSSM